MDGFLISISILAFLMSFSIGANDAANALATSYGSNALRLLYLVILGSIFEFIGAFFCSGHVAGALVGNIIENVDTLDDHLVEQMMLATSIAGFLFIICSSVFGMPISGTHTVVGALIGSGLATVGSENINWRKLGMIAASWVVAPLVSIVLAAIFFILVCMLTLDKSRFEFSKRLLFLTAFTSVAFLIIAVMFVKLVQDKGDDMTGGAIAFLTISPILGVFITRLVILLLLKPVHIGYSRGAIVLLKFWNGEDFVELYNEKKAQTLTVNLEDETQGLLSKKEDDGEEKIIFELYRWLMLVAAMTVCLGHGANDVANSISPLLTVMTVEGNNSSAAYLIGSAGIAFGLLVLGYKVMETVGKNVVKLDFARGFTAQFATAISVNVGSIIGLPLSSTHCMVGSLMGLMVALKLSDSVKKVYPPEEEN